MTTQHTTLKNGLRVITDTVKAVDSVALGVWTNVGSRHEDLAHNGISHMVEHMLFKGTEKRNALQIAEEIENVGGNVNAWTSRELTTYHIHLLKEYMPLALDVLSDIVQHSVMPEDEIERERHVILQEIGMTTDTPDDLVFDHYQGTAYPKQSLGKPILGQADIIRTMPRETLMNHVKCFYTPKNLVVSAAGNLDHDHFVQQVETVFDALPPENEVKQGQARYNGGESRSEKELEQSHVILGFQGISRLDQDIYAAMLLSTLFGGGMSSRLFQEVREKRGLVYSVFSYHSSYQDDGQFLIYAGTGPNDLPELMPVLCDEIKKLFDTIRDEELNRAKAQLRATLLMSRESMMSRANQQAKHLIHFDSVLDMNDKIEKINTVTVKDLHRIAQKIFASKPTLAALGPLEKLESYDVVASRLAA